MDMERPDNRVHQLPVGDRSVRVVVPDRGVEEEGDRISLWWGVTTSAVALAEALLDGTDRSGQRAIELGCGAGLGGIAAGLAGAHVTFTDLVPEALENACRNARRNGLPERRCATLALDWEAPTAAGRHDLVLGAEVTYDYFLHDALLRLLDQVCTPGGEVWLADRRRLVVDRFVGRLHTQGWTVDGSVSTVDVVGLPRQQVTVWRCSRAR